MSWDGFLSTSALLAHVDISPMEAHEEEPKAKETMKEPVRDKRVDSKGKCKIQVAQEEAQFIYRSRTRFSRKQLNEKPTP